MHPLNRDKRSFLLHAHHFTSRISKARKGPIFLLLFTVFVIGLCVGQDYGSSVDEYLHQIYVDQNLEILRGERNPDDTLMNLRYYGPAFSFFSVYSARAMRFLLPSWRWSELIHLTYFFSFLLGIYYFYYILQRFVGRGYAIAGTILFASQPLFFGHAFINPKDLPFMALFIASIAKGLEFTDVFFPPEQNQRNRAPSFTAAMKSLRDGWRLLARKRRIILIFLIALIPLGALEFFVYKHILSWGSNFIEQAYEGMAWGPINQLFQAIAQDAWKTPLDLYLLKLLRFYAWAKYALFIFLLLPAAFYAKRVLDLNVFLAFVKSKRRWWILLQASLFLGLCISIRIAGLLAAMLIVLNILWKEKQKAAFPLIIYGAFTSLSTYLTWPYLWGSFIPNLIKTARYMIQFPHSSPELYQGFIYQPGTVPRYFLPHLIILQFTEPVIILVVLSTVIGLVTLYKNRRMDPDLATIALWFALPFAMQVGLNASIYNNFRQYLFITPPIILSAAIGLSTMIRALPWRSARMAICLLAIMPGIVAIISLHPYEYIYYNMFTGGVEGAYGRYQTDYWCTAYREAMELVNADAEPNADVAVWGVKDPAAPYAREDLKLYNVRRKEEVRAIDPDYVIVGSFCGVEKSFLADIENTWEIKEGGATLAVIKKLER
jgi:hypothetical protein